MVYSVALQVVSRIPPLTQSKEHNSTRALQIAGLWQGKNNSYRFREPLAMQIRTTSSDLKHLLLVLGVSLGSTLLPWSQNVR